MGTKLREKMQKAVEQRGGRPVQMSEPTVTLDTMVEFVTERAVRVAANGDEFWIPK